MNKNIEIRYKDGKVEFYELQSTDELKLPSLAFRKEEEAELAISIAKVLKVNGVDNYFNSVTRDIQYVFRVLGLKNSEWF